MIRRTFADRRFLTTAVLSVSLFVFIAAEFSSPLEAQTSGTANLTVRVTGARNTKGKIRVALFRASKGFPNDASQAVRTLHLSISWYIELCSTAQTR